MSPLHSTVHPVETKTVRGTHSAAGSRAQRAFNHKQNPHTSSYESKAMVSTVYRMFVYVCVSGGGIIDNSLNPVLLFLNNSVDITLVQTIKNCTGFDLSQFV